MDKRKIVLPILIGAIALGSASASIAWYASSNRLVIDSIKISFDTSLELQISTSDDLDSFKESLSYSELNQVGAFVPVSSMYREKWEEEKKTRPVFYDASHYSVDLDGKPFLWTTNAGYFCQDLYIMANDNVDVTLDVLDTYIKPNSLFNNAYASEIRTKYPDLTEEEIIERLDSLTKAMRFSVLISDEDFYSYTIIDPNRNETEDIIFAGALDNNNASHTYFDFYQKNEELYETCYGEVYNRENLVYSEPSENDSDFVLDGDPSAFNAMHKKGVKVMDLEESIANHDVIVGKEKAITLEEIDQDPDKFYFPVYKYTPRKITLSIYIEGWDLDSVNYTMGASFLSNMSFKIYRGVVM